MDLETSELETLTFTSIILTSISIPRSSPRTFSLLTLTLIFPLSFAILAHSLFTHPLFLHLTHSSSSSHSYNKDLSLLLIYQLSYLLFLFTFSLLSTSSIVFAVSSLYSSSSSSFSSSLSSIPSILPRLLLTFLFILLLFLLYYLLFSLSFLLFPHLLLLPLLPLFLLAHIYISALWHLASVLSVLEPLSGLPALRKSHRLLRGRTRLAFALVSAYLGACAVIGAVFRAVVVAGPGEKGSLGVRVGVGVKVVAGGALVSVLVVVNLVGLLVQCVFYYVCKSYHHQGIDKSALADHLGGFLGEYVPLKSSIQMENL